MPDFARLHVLFAPGAGLPSTSPWMTAWADRLRTAYDVTTMDYGYVREGKKRPDPLPVLMKAHEEAARATGARDRLVLAGKSMGSRIGCHVAAKVGARALVCFGYPLVGASKAKPVRDAVLLELDRPILFVQGTRDALCPLDHLAEVRAKMKARNELYVVEGGDHSLEVPKRSPVPQAEWDTRVLDAVRAFLASVG